MYLSFDEYSSSLEMNERSYLPSIAPGMDSVAFQSWQTPSFTVKLLGINTSRWENEPPSNDNGKSLNQLKRGDMIQVFDMKKDKTLEGKYISGIKNSDGTYKKITLTVNGKTITLKPADVEKVK
jgi:hypothetical protein